MHTTHTHPHTHTHTHTHTPHTHTYVASVDLHAESSSLGDILEESDWELNSDVAMATVRNRVTVRGSTEAEKEIR